MLQLNFCANNIYLLIYNQSLSKAKQLSPVPKSRQDKLIYLFIFFINYRTVYLFSSDQQANLSHRCNYLSHETNCLSEKLTLWLYPSLYIRACAFALSIYRFSMDLRLSIKLRKNEATSQLLNTVTLVK